MTISRVTRIHHITDPSKENPKKLIRDFSDDGLRFGSISEDVNGMWLCGVKSTELFIAPVVLKEIEHAEYSAVITLIDDHVYVLTKYGNLAQEFYFNPNEEGGLEVRRFAAHIDLYQSNFVEVKVFTNLEATGDSTSADFGGLIELPIGIESVTSVEWLDDIASRAWVGKELKTMNFKSTKSKYKSNALLATAAFFVIAILGALMVSEDEEPIEVVASIAKPIINKYQGLETFHTKQSYQVKPLLHLLTREMKKTTTLSGWGVLGGSIRPSNSGFFSVSIILESQNGKMSSLSNYAAENNFLIDVAEGLAVLSIKVKGEPLFRNSARFHLGSWSHWISNAVSDWWDGTEVKVSKNDDFEGQFWVVNDVAVKFKDVVPEDMASIGTLLDGYPFGFNKVEILKEKGSDRFYKAELKLMIGGVQYNG